MIYFCEDKEVVTRALFQALKTTVEGVNLAEMEYKRLQDNTELVTLIYDNGYRKTVNVSCDSGVALMKDVLRAIVL